MISLSNGKHMPYFIPQIRISLPVSWPTGFAQWGCYSEEMEEIEVNCLWVQNNLYSKSCFSRENPNFVGQIRLTFEDKNEKKDNKEWTENKLFQRYILHHKRSK